mmetsp:Transcript_4901/g.14430  ORF Transcript_4901/g.14430 Transcript_4901/m.14430 type:complete len:189 (-) Transcript_4901:188-754(-)
MERIFLTKSWEVRIQITILGIMFCNLYCGWTRVLGQEGMLKEVVHDLGMALIRRGRAELNTLGCGITPPSGGGRGRPTNVQRSNSVTASSAGMLPPRAPFPSFPSGQDDLHKLSSFRVAAGKLPMYQSNCVICGGDTSWFCALCGEGCALHPEKTRFGKEYDCLAKHRECPSYRKWARRQRTTSGVSD